MASLDGRPLDLVVIDAAIGAEELLYCLDEFPKSTVLELLEHRKWLRGKVDALRAENKELKSCMETPRIEDMETIDKLRTALEAAPDPDTPYPDAVMHLDVFEDWYNGPRKEALE